MPKQKKSRGRPTNPRVKISGLKKYLDSLPDDALIRQGLTQEKRLIIDRYIQELEYLEATMKRLKADIKKFGEVEVFTQGIQTLRRKNPAMELYLSSQRSYRGFIREINDILKGIEVEW